MPVKQFYFLGEDISTSRDINFDSAIDFHGLKNLIAAHFAVVKPGGKWNTHAGALSHLPREESSAHYQKG
jgi:hypothetical protein